MKIYIQLIFTVLTLNCIAQPNEDINSKVDTLNHKVVELEKKNDILLKKIDEYKISKNSNFEIIDKVDNLYNNNFNRFILFWGILASIITIGIPYYITRIQKKIIETKKTEILSYSSIELNKLEAKFSLELTQKYKELSDLINNSNQDNKKELKKEFIKTIILNHFFAAKINELDKKYNYIFINLKNAVLKSNSINYYNGVNTYLKSILRYLTKFQEQNIKLNKKNLAQIAEDFKTLNNIDEVDQDLLEDVLEKLIA